MKTVGIVFSDHHLEYWGKYNKGGRRTRVQMDILENLFALAEKRKCPLIFTGDLFHNPNSLSNALLSMVLYEFRVLFTQYPNVNLYAISGNHDLSGINTLTHRSPSYILTLSRLFDNFHCLDFTSLDFEHFTLHGLPYITHNEDYEKIVNMIEVDYSKFNILLNHADYAGQKDTNGIVIGKGENISDSLFDKFDKVLSGHVHKKDRINKKVLSIGATHEQKFSDRGGSFGYWVIKKKGGSLRFMFIEKNWAPKFIMYTDESQITDDYNYWVKEPKPEDDIISTLDLEDIGNAPIKMARSYAKQLGLNRSKRSILIELVKEVGDED
jgi:DNA repair exonuclease SbcCD nuclease subunit